MNKHLLLFALMLKGLCSFCQTTTTISYANLGLVNGNANNTNVLASPITIDGYTNKTLLTDNTSESGIDGPMYFNEQGLLLPGNMVGWNGIYGTNMYWCGVAYTLGYTFQPNYIYTVVVNITPLEYPGSGYQVDNSVVGMAVTTGSAATTTNVNYTGFGSYWDSECELFDSKNPGETWSPHCDVPFLYQTGTEGPLYANYFYTDLATQNVTVLNNYSTFYTEVGLNIESMGAQQGMSTFSALIINSVSITSVPQITPNVTYIGGCTSQSQVYSVNTTYPVSWSVTPSGYLTLTPNGASCTVAGKAPGGNCVLTATMNGMTASIPISTQPTFTAVNATMSGPCDNGYQAWLLDAVPNAPTAKDWNWTVSLDGGSYYFTSQDIQTPTVNIDGRLGLSVTYEDVCNTLSTLGGTEVYSNCNEPESIHFDASPNPASTTMELLPHRNPGGGVTPLIREIKVFDLQGRIRSDVHYGGATQEQVSVSNLENGVYFVLIYMQDGNTERKKILVQH